MTGGLQLSLLGDDPVTDALATLARWRAVPMGDGRYALTRTTADMGVVTIAEDGAIRGTDDVSEREISAMSTLHAAKALGRLTRGRE